MWVPSLTLAESLNRQCQWRDRLTEGERGTANSFCGIGGGGTASGCCGIGGERGRVLFFLNGTINYLYIKVK